jgi:hypothetical protein
MPKTLHNALTEKTIAAALRSRDGKLRRLVDGRGLRLVLLPSGRSRWELRQQPSGGAKEVTIDLGDYPAITLTRARFLADDARTRARQEGRPGGTSAIACVSAAAPRLLGTKLLPITGHMSHGSRPELAEKFEVLGGGVRYQQAVSMIAIL